MKTIRLLATFVFLVSSSSIAFSSIPQTNKKDSLAIVVKQAVTSKHFKFVASFAYPSGGQAKYLTPDYELKVLGDTTTSYLPFFGRAYSVPYGSSDGGIKFTSTKSEYAYKQSKKGGFDITINTQDTPEKYVIFISVAPSGSASLTVLSNNRESMRFSGTLEPTN